MRPRSLRFLLNSKNLFLRKIYLFYNIYLRNFKYLNGGSQFNEDIYLNSFFKKDYRGKFVDLGCFHPTRDNNTFRFYKKNWTGINVDLNPITIELFNFFRSNTIPDILVYAKSFGGGKASISGYTTRDHVMKKAYDNSDDFSLQSSTYNGFGEETITAIEAINIMINNDYENKSISNGKKLKAILENVKIKFPNIVDEIRGSGSFQGFTFKNPINNTLENIVTKFIIFAGSVSLVLLYFALFLIPKQAQFKILSFLPMINKIFNFYRKLILIAYYEN